MELKIEIDETRFKDVLENELKAFSKEELHEIIHQSMEGYLKNSEIIKSLFVTTKFDYFGKSEKVASDLLKTSVENMDLSPAYTEIKDLMINELKTNYRDVLISLLEDVISSGLTKILWNSDSLQDKIRNMTSEIVHCNH